MAEFGGEANGAVRDYAASVATVTGAASILHNPSLGLGDVVTIRPMDGTVYLGGAAVTAADGFPVNAGEAFELRRAGSPVFAITAGGSVEVRKLVEVYF